MPSDVFICYSVKDMPVAEALRAKIEAAGPRCWISSRDIPFAADWDKSVAAALKSCRVLALVFSSHSNNSEQISGEVKQAFENGLAVMALRVEDETPAGDLTHYQPHIQWLDALTAPMERHIDKFVSQVSAFISDANAKGVTAPVKPAVVIAPPKPVAAPPPRPAEQEPAGKRGALIFVLALLLAAGAFAAWWFGAGKQAQLSGNPAQPATPTPAPYVPPVSTAKSAPRPTPPPAPPPTKHMLQAAIDHPFVNSLGMKFVPVPGTNVLFSIWDTRVRDYRACAEANPGLDKSWQDPGFKQTGDHPVVNESWDDAKAFCAWLTQKERKQGAIGPDEQYRLPTDAEWTAAAGTATYPWGAEWPPPVGAGNYDPTLKVDDYENTSPVGSFAANQYGLFDIGGNVWQWCEDWYRIDMTPKALLEKYPELNDDGLYRVVRGGCWSSGPIVENLLTSFRYNGAPENRDNRYGFRCVLVAAPPAP